MSLILMSYNIKNFNNTYTNRIYTHYNTCDNIKTTKKKTQTNPSTVLNSPPIFHQHSFPYPRHYSLSDNGTIHYSSGFVGDTCVQQIHLASPISRPFFRRISNRAFLIATPLITRINVNNSRSIIHDSLHVSLCLFSDRLIGI